MRDRARDRGSDLGEDVRVRIEMAHFMPGPLVREGAAHARRHRSDAIEARVRRRRRAAVRDAAPPAPAVGAARVDIGGRSYALHTAVTQLTMPFNLSGLPAVSMPWTPSREGVPICLQVVARRGHDWRALAAAQRLQARRPGPGAALRQRCSPSTSS